MKQLNLSIILVFMLFGFPGIAQSISPAPGNSTVCPGQAVNYTVNPNPNFSNCSSFTWTITNGSFVFGANPAVTVKTTTAVNVDVFWNDVASAGTLKVTSSCSEGTLSVGPLSYAIRSLAGRTPANARKNRSLPYCSRLDISLAVDVMFLENTGGTTGVTQQRADGYEWELPAGWSYSGSTGTVTTSSELINIYPDDDCRGGTVTVKAFKDCNSGRKYSAPASIDVNRPDPELTITPQAGYSGPRCGQVQAVTFTVTPISCASNYTWVFPIGWAPGPFVAGNSVTLTPRGDESDAGQIQVTANLTCANIASKPYILKFNHPQILSPPAICYGGTTVSLSNAPATGINWDPGNNMLIESGQGTPQVVLKAATSTTKGQGTIRATIACTSSTSIVVPPKYVWVGKANMVAQLNNGQLITYSSTYNNVCNYVSYKTVMNLEGSTSNVWQRIAANPSNTSWVQDGNNISFYFWAVGQTATFRLTSGNACATGVYDFKFKSVTCSSDPCSQYQVSPNPSSSEVNITPNIPAPCAMQSTQIETQESDLTIQSINLYSSDGQLMRTEEFLPDTRNVKVDVSDLRKGVYILKITNGTFTETHRIHIKE